MTIEVYRKRSIPGGYVIDEQPDFIYYDVTQIEPKPYALIGNVNGKEFSVPLDCNQYKYIIV